jgi:hypothetical protein
VHETSSSAALPIPDDEFAYDDWPGEEEGMCRHGILRPTIWTCEWDCVNNVWRPILFISHQKNNCLIIVYEFSV